MLCVGFVLNRHSYYVPHVLTDVTKLTLGDYYVLATADSIHIIAQHPLQVFGGSAETSNQRHGSVLEHQISSKEIFDLD